MAKEVLCFHIVDFAASDILHGGVLANPRPQVSGGELGYLEILESLVLPK